MPPLRNQATKSNNLPTSPPRCEVGDVLILWTRETYTIFAIGTVCRPGQRDFRGQRDVVHTVTRLDAIAAARPLLGADSRILLLDIDTGRWSEISRRSPSTRGPCR